MIRCEARSCAPASHDARTSRNGNVFLGKAYCPHELWKPRLCFEFDQSNVVLICRRIEVLMDVYLFRCNPVCRPFRWCQVVVTKHYDVSTECERLLQLERSELRETIRGKGIMARQSLGSKLFRIFRAFKIISSSLFFIWSWTDIGVDARCTVSFSKHGSGTEGKLPDTIEPEAQISDWLKAERRQDWINFPEWKAALSPSLEIERLLESRVW